MKLNFKSETYDLLIAEANRRNQPVAKMISELLDQFTNNLIKEEGNGKKEQPVRV